MSSFDIQAIESTNVQVIESTNEDEQIDNRSFCLVRMIPAKVSYFCYSAMVGCYVGFINIFFRDVGLTIQESGFISGMTFLTVAAVAPLWGLLVDYTGRPKLIFAMLFCGQICCVFSMPFVAGAISPYQPHNKTITNETTVSNASSGHNTLSDALLNSELGAMSNSLYSSDQNIASTTYSNSDQGTFSSKLFFAMLIIDCTSKAFIAPLHAMIDATVMNVMETEPRATFGEQRLFGLSFGIFAFVAGAAVDRFGGYFEKMHLTKYTVAFVIYLPVALVTLPVCIYLLNQMNLNVEDASSKKKKEEGKTILAIKTFSRFKNLIFLLTVFIVGFSAMMFVAYLYIQMKDKMHSSKTLMGLSSLVQSFTQLLVFPFADKLLDVCGGTINAFELAVVSYGIRYVLNSFIINPWLILLTQMFHCFGFSLFWVAVVKHTQKIAPKEIYVTMFTIVNGSYYGVGGLAGNMLGGVVYGRFGGDVLFRGMGVLCGLWTGVMLLSFQGYEYFMKRRGKVHPIS